MIEWSIHKLRKQKENNELAQEFLDSWCIYVKYYHQYAEGITGANRRETAYIQENGIGYPYAAAGYKAAKDAGIKKIDIKGKKTPYGSIGREYQSKKAIQLKDLIDTVTHQELSPPTVLTVMPKPKH